MFIGTVLVNVLLPVVHPRMATPDTAANEITLIEPPGFLMLNYGRSTFVVTLVAHIAYGALVGLHRPSLNPEPWHLAPRTCTSHSAPPVS